MPEIDELEIDEIEMDESEISEHESENEINLLDDQQLIQDIEEYTCLINQPAKTEDALTDEGIIEMVIHEFRNSDDETDEEELPLPSPITMMEAIDALKKVISYQESLEVGKGFNENELTILRKRFREWCSERDKNKKQSSILSFFNCDENIDLT
jgi:hypothetical protein